METAAFAEAQRWDRLKRVYGVQGALRIHDICESLLSSKRGRRTPEEKAWSWAIEKYEADLRQRRPDE
jgi:hypothetical protein